MSAQRVPVVTTSVGWRGQLDIFIAASASRPDGTYVFTEADLRDLLTAVAAYAAAPADGRAARPLAGSSAGRDVVSEKTVERDGQGRVVRIVERRGR